MGKLQYILFDLDGTLTDPGPGITNCVAHALERFDIHPATREELYPYIGAPLTWSFKEYHGLSDQQAEQALLYYRERFSVKGLYENELFAGIPELLADMQLLAEGCRLLSLDYLGGSGTRGYGRVMFDHFAVEPLLGEIPLNVSELNACFEDVSNYATCDL